MKDTRNKRTYRQNCRQCGKYYEGRGEFACSRNCYSLSRKGKRVSSLTEFKKGNVSWSKLNPDKMPRGENNHKWVGDKVNYYSLHIWVKNNYEWEKKCQICEIKENLTLASKNYNYSRKKEDWWILCNGCNTRYDYQNGWGEATRRFGLHG